jgi:hypothetical protein
MTRQIVGADTPAHPTAQTDGQAMTGIDIEERVRRLEAWVEAATRALASLAWYDFEALLTELDHARGYTGEEDEPDPAG